MRLFSVVVQKVCWQQRDHMCHANGLFLTQRSSNLFPLTSKSQPVFFALLTTPCPHQIFRFSIFGHRGTKNEARPGYPA